MMKQRAQTEDELAIRRIKVFAKDPVEAIGLACRSFYNNSAYPQCFQVALLELVHLPGRVGVFLLVSVLVHPESVRKVGIVLSGKGCSLVQQSRRSRGDVWGHDQSSREHGHDCPDKEEFGEHRHDGFASWNRVSCADGWTYNCEGWRGWSSIW